MALFHLSVTQTKRSAGQSAIASAAYRAGERLYSEYYGEYSDYTRKGGVICSDILLPSHAPPEYADRQTLWNAVEKAERGKNAQLAYSFDIALQNEFSLEENIALARQFLLENFVSRGMVVDFAVHQPDREDGGIPNPHFHVLCPIRPIEQNGKWGLKQRRVYELDEDGNRIRDADGKFVFNAVPTTDWGSPETLEHWRQTWAELCNAKFAEKGLDVRIDHRSYERQGVELLPTVHEGATVRAMEKKGIRTEKGEFNRWIKATNAVIRDIKKKIALLFDWIAEAKAELAKPQAPNLVSLLNAYYTQRKAGAYSQKGKISNLKEMNETFNYLRANGIYTLEDLESHVNEHSSTTESLKKTLDGQTARMKEIKRLYDYSATFQSLKPVCDGLQKIKFEKSRAKYKAEHADELKMFYTARRKLTEEFPDGKVDMNMLSKRQYELMTGRRQKSDVIAYQIRQSFKPGEITAEEANKVGYELAMRFTKGKYAFIVATHTDRQHIHNHVIFNSTALDGTRKFRDFFFSALAVQRLSDLICLEHQLSVIEKKPYRERQKRVVYPPKESNRDRLCGIIDTILAEKPEDYEAFLQKLEQQGYEVKRGKYTAVKGKGQKRFIRFRTLGTGYSEEEIKAVLEGKAKHQPYQKKPTKEQSFQLLVDIQGKMAQGKSVGYKKWATKFNLKEMSKTLLFLQEQKIGSAEELRERAAAATERYHVMGDSIKAAEARLTEIAVLKTNIINYAKTREVYAAYRKAGYSKVFLEAHREEITLHKVAKAAFDEAGLKKLPNVKALDAEFAELLTKKKAAYPDYRKARNEMQELVRAQKNIERFFAEEKPAQENEQAR